MFELGWAEIGIIGLVALLVLGPEEFVSVARKAGRVVGGLRRSVSQWQSELDAALPLEENKDKNKDTDKKDGAA